MKKKSKLAAVKSAWPIGIGFLIVGAVVGYVLYTSAIEEQRQTSQDNVRDIAMGGFVFSESKKAVFPDSAGDLLRNLYARPGHFLSPWSEMTLPTNFDQLSEQEQVDWVNRHTDYIYLPSGKRAHGDEIIVFELAPPGRFDDVAVATYADIYTDQPLADRGKARRIPYDEADALIKSQTGYSIKDWYDAETPGAGLMKGQLVPRPESEWHIPRS